MNCAADAAIDQKAAAEAIICWFVGWEKDK